MIPTAEEFLKQETSQHQFSYTHSLIKFAKMHVIEALKQVNEELEANYGYYNYQDLTLNIYPLENIK